jgi:hypothetical protein
VTSGSRAVTWWPSRSGWRRASRCRSPGRHQRRNHAIGADQRRGPGGRRCRRADHPARRAATRALGRRLRGGRRSHRIATTTCGQAGVLGCRPGLGHRPRCGLDGIRDQRHRASRPTSPSCATPTSWPPGARPWVEAPRPVRHRRPGLGSGSRPRNIEAKVRQDGRRVSSRRFGVTVSVPESQVGGGGRLALGARWRPDPAIGAPAAAGQRQRHSPMQGTIVRCWSTWATSSEANGLRPQTMKMENIGRQGRVTGSGRSWPVGRFRRRRRAIE